MTPVVGHLTTLALVSATYFSGTCKTVKLKQSQSTTVTTNQLPYWITFDELNKNLVMYPPDIITLANQIYLEYYCCNAILECAMNSFIVTPINTNPVMAYSPSSYIMQYDTKSSIG